MVKCPCSKAEFAVLETAWDIGNTPYFAAYGNPACAPPLVPGLSLVEVLTAVADMSRRGLIEFSPRRGRRDHNLLAAVFAQLQENGEKAFNNWRDIHYFLTVAGARLWTACADPDWQHFVGWYQMLPPCGARDGRGDSDAVLRSLLVLRRRKCRDFPSDEDYGPIMTVITSADKRFMQRYLDWVLARIAPSGRLASLRFRIVGAWSPTYWKRIPRAYSLRVVTDGFFGSSPWDEGPAIPPNHTNPFVSPSRIR